MARNIRVLYLSYDGMTDPLGQSQVLSYLRPMSEQGVEFDVISFEKPNLFKTKKAVIDKMINGKRINWHPLLYTKKPPVLSTVKDIFSGWHEIKRLYKKQHFDIVHCRGYISALLGLRAKKKYDSLFIFDMRGFFPDEKKESGYWKGNLYQPVYRYFKFKERQFFEQSDYNISLTYAGKAEIEKTFNIPGEKIGVIPTCVDFNIFKPFDSSIRNSIRQELQITQDATTLLYSGSIGTSYRPDIIFNIFRNFRAVKENSILLIISHTDKEVIESELKKAGIDTTIIRIVSSDYLNVHRYLMAGDYGVIMYDKSYSAIGRSPTKLAEYWACGLPFISQKNLGDLDYIIEKYPNGGVLIDAMDDNGIQTALKKLVKNSIDKSALRKDAMGYFDLKNGVLSYLTIYDQIINFQSSR
jgi:glycosyltransferase involved in cell wall biosynthesis